MFHFLGVVYKGHGAARLLADWCEGQCCTIT
jgi:hypothetical protein